MVLRNCATLLPTIKRVTNDTLTNDWIKPKTNCKPNRDSKPNSNLTHMLQCRILKRFTDGATRYLEINIPNSFPIGCRSASTAVNPNYIYKPVLVRTNLSAAHINLCLTS